MRRCARSLLALALVVGCSRSSSPTIGIDPTPATHDAAAPPPPPKPELPPGWDAAEMSLDPPSPLRVSVVLAYRSMVDDRPLYLDEAIVWVHELPGETGAERWRLLHVYRHPKDEDDAWQLSIVYDAVGYSPSESYDHAPTIDETKTFLEKTWWWQRDDSFEKLAVGMPASAWRKAFGADPITPPPAFVDEAGGVKQ